MQKSISSDNHAKLVGHLNWLATLTTQPMQILQSMELVRNPDGWFWVEPASGVLINTRIENFTVASLSHLAKPKSTRLWDITRTLTACYDDITQVFNYIPAAKFTSIYELLDILTDAYKMLKDELSEDSLPDAKPEEIEKAKEILARLKNIFDNEAELREPVYASECITGYSKEVCNTRYKLWKHDGGTELIKAIRLIKHPATRTRFIDVFKFALADINPALAEVISVINKPRAFQPK